MQQRVFLFTATVVIGNELIELMLFDTTGQVMITALASVYIALSSPSTMQCLSRSDLRAVLYSAHDLAHFHRESLSLLLLHGRHSSVTSFHRPLTGFVEPVAYSTSSYFLRRLIAVQRLS